jgi:tRNA threonylcarbamoyladenosine biosynthesis protein TsaB
VTVAFSTYSPQTSVALISADASVIWAGAESAPQGASGALARLLRAALEATGLTFSAVSGYAVDLGPGSFTGVRVGVVFAKVLAFSQDLRIQGASAFDLIDPCGCAFVPSRRGEVFVREPGCEPYKLSEPPHGALGYEYGADGRFPHAAAFTDILAKLPRLSPFDILPAYLAQPSISMPKTPFAEPRG